MKKILCIGLIICITLSNSVVYANENITNYANVSSIIIKATKEDALVEIIKVGNSYVYSHVSNDEILSITIKNDCVVEFAYNNYKDDLIYSTDEVPLNQIGIESIKNTTKKDLTNVFYKISNCIKNYNMPAKRTLIPRSNVEAITSNNLLRSVSSPFTAATFTKVMQDKGFSTFDAKVVSINHPYGIQATVKERGTLDVAKESSHLVEASTAIGLITAITGLSAGTLTAIGIFAITVAGVLQTACKQQFIMYKCQWIGAKWVELYGSGNYYQAEKCVRYQGIAGSKDYSLLYISDMADNYYNSNIKLCELAAEPYRPQ
ncbi:hypothetical protein AN1V17_04630 [Vallitalea sediminicola]